MTAWRQIPITSGDIAITYWILNGSQTGWVQTEGCVRVYECVLKLMDNTVDFCLHFWVPQTGGRGGEEIPWSIKSVWMGFHSVKARCAPVFITALNHHFHFSNSFHLLLQAADLATIVWHIACARESCVCVCMTVCVCVCVCVWESCDWLIHKP